MINSQCFIENMGETVYTSEFLSSVIHLFWIFIHFVPEKSDICLREVSYWKLICMLLVQAHSPVSALRYMSSVFECSLSIDCCVDFGSVCNAPGLLLNCQNILN